MRKKRPTRGKKTNRRKKTTRPKTTRAKNTTRAKKTIRPKKTLRARKTTGAKKQARAKRQFTGRAAVRYKGSGPDTAGQSGDIQGLSDVAGVDSESVAELIEEGQAFEAGLVSGVENAPDADVAEVTTKEIPEDDVPPEYRERE
jgi:hypothetical protein